MDQRTRESQSRDVQLTGRPPARLQLDCIAPIRIQHLSRSEACLPEPTMSFARAMPVLIVSVLAACSADPVAGSLGDSAKPDSAAADLVIVATGTLPLPFATPVATGINSAA